MIDVSKEEGIGLSGGPENKSVCRNSNEGANTNCNERPAMKTATESHANMIDSDHDEGVTVKAKQATKAVTKVWFVSPW